MHVVNAAVLDEWTILPDKAVVSHVLDGRVARLLIQSRRCPERPELPFVTRAVRSRGGGRSRSYRLVAPHSQTAGARNHTVPTSR
jgi:hypothetical protein